MTTQTLLPCPFCGFDDPKLKSNGIGDFYICCYGEDDEAWCGASSSAMNCETERGAADRWNRRARS